VQGIVPFLKAPEFRVSIQCLAICPWTITAEGPEIQPNASRINVAKRGLALRFTTVAEVALNKRCGVKIGGGVMSYDLRAFRRTPACFASEGMAIEFSGVLKA
jgi:hypothetical protein